MVLAPFLPRPRSRGILRAEKGGDDVALKRYRVDLRSLSDEENKRVYDLLDRISETGLIATRVLRVHEFFLDERVSVTAIPGLPEGLIRQIP